MENEKLKKWGDSYSEEPKDYIWSRIENRLDTTPTVVSRINWKRFLIAANIIVVLVAIFSYSNFWQHGSKSYFAYNVNQKPIIMEDLSEEKLDLTSIYSVTNIKSLKEAYRKQGFQ